MVISIYFAIVFVTVAILLYLFRKDFKGRKREKYIKEYVFPEAIRDKVLKRYPELKTTELHYVEHCLRNYFLVCRRSARKMTAMPSRVVDVAWHEFILHSREYHDFCRQAFGCHLHHSPFSKMDVERKIMKKTWGYCCEIENINRKNPASVPRLFNIDSQLKIHDGNKSGRVIAAYIKSIRQDDAVVKGVRFLENFFDAGSGPGGDGGGGCGGCGGGGD